MMTGKQLHTYTRKRLAAMARHRQVAGWHDMCKADLIKALQDEDRRQEPASPSNDEFPENREQTTTSRVDDAHRHKPKASLTPPHQQRQTAAHALLRTADCDEGHFSAMAVSLYWICAEWTLTRDALRRVERALGPARHTAQPVLRLYDVTDDDRLTHAVTFVSDTPIPRDTCEWFVQVDQPGGTYQLQLGILADDGEFYRLESSSRINTSKPNRGSLPAFVRHSPRRTWRVPRNSRDSAEPMGLPLSLDVEIVIRGRTDPQATVAIADDGIAVEPDGTFEHSLPLVEGRQVIPTTVIGPERRRSRTIVLAIQHNSRRLDPQGPEDH